MNPVRVERAGAVATITLDRPDKLNALDLPMRQALAAAFTELTDDEGIRVIVVTGGDKGPDEVRALGFADLWRPIAECPKPVIAAVSGFALGAGGELLMMCDIVIADSSARIGQPEIRVGIMPGAGGTQRLVRLVGKQVASLMLMTGDPVTGVRAAELGLVSELAPQGQALARATEIAGKIARMPPLALSAIKRVLATGQNLALPDAMALENAAFLNLFSTADQKEGMAAFLDKRKPVFEGR